VYLFCASDESHLKLTPSAPTPSEPSPQTLGDCGVNPDNETGYMVLYLEGISQRLNEAERMFVEGAFHAVYNNISAG
jgi:hypothetical protein